MPTRKPRYKRNPKDYGRKSLSAEAVKAMADITGDKSTDWTADEAAKEAERRGKVPPEVYKNAYDNAVKNWLTDNCRRKKKNVGTEGEKRMIRMFAVYDIETGPGEPKRMCWREWCKLDWWEHRRALEVLFKNSNRVAKVALDTFKYVNELRTSAGQSLLILEDFDGM